MTLLKDIFGFTIYCVSFVIVLPIFLFKEYRRRKYEERRKVPDV
jgi:hypothetical protein